MIPIRKRDFTKEVKFFASRSSGPGGQSVNKVNTQIQLRFNITSSVILNDKEKSALLFKLKSQLTKDGDLIITAQTERSQVQNKKQALFKFYMLLENLLIPDKVRIATRPSKAVKSRRLEQKRRRSEQKSLRRKML
jgi:ribosome-associated protein